MLLITPQEVVSLAFTSHEEITSQSIRSLKIDIAQERYIRPRFGNEFFDRMCEGQYADFVNQYIKPALAEYVRYSLVDELSVQLSDNGAVIYGKTNEATDTHNNSDGSQKTTRTKTDQSEGGKSEHTEGSQTQNVARTSLTEKESFIDITIANYPQENSAETGTVQDNTTGTSLSDVTTDYSDQLISSDQSQVEHSDSGQVNQNKVSQSYRVASVIERRIIAAQALSDANVLLAKAVRYVERNEQQFEYYLPQNVASRIFF